MPSMHRQHRPQEQEQKHWVRLNGDGTQQHSTVPTAEQQLPDSASWTADSTVLTAALILEATFAPAFLTADDIYLPRLSIVIVLDCVQYIKIPVLWADFRRT